MTESNPKKGLLKKHNFYSASCLLLPVINHPMIEKQVIKADTETYKDKSHFPIELLFYGVESLAHNFKAEVTAGGGEIIKFVGHKKRFAENCKDLSANDFNNFKVLFECIESTFKESNALSQGSTTVAPTKTHFTDIEITC